MGIETMKQETMTDILRGAGRAVVRSIAYTAIGLGVFVGTAGLGGCRSSDNLEGWGTLGEKNTTLRHKSIGYWGKYDYPLEDGWRLRGEDGDYYILTRARESGPPELKTMPKTKFEKKYGTPEELSKENKVLN